MITSTCPSRETLFQYSVGMLDDAERDALEEHLDGCPDCQATIITLDDADDTVARRLRAPLSSEPFLAEPQLQDALAAAMALPLPTPHAQADAGSSVGLAAAMPETLGEYQLLEKLGQGGMGTVYKAWHTKLDRVVALKILSCGRVGDRQAITRFEREMKAVGRLAHPNIVHAHDAREIEGMPVLIMEFVDGLDLAEVVRRTGPVGVAEACELVRRTALALQCAHEHGLVHRDIKPSNIMLTAAGEVKLLDLGLARFYAEGPGIDAPSAGDEMTGTGQAMGTADYMAPEQASDCHTVDIRADLYSLGCTLYKLLSGRAPFSGRQYASALEKMHAHVHESVPPLRDVAPAVPAELAAILDRLLAKDPGERFATPAEVATVLEPFCRSANLVELVTRAMASDGSPLSLRERVRVRAAGADGGRSSFPGNEKVRASAPSRRIILRRILIALGFLAAMAGAFAAGILITIKRNGKETTIDVPEGSAARIGAAGQVEVTLPGEPSSQPHQPVIEDTGVVRVTALEATEPMTWRWNVHLPKGQKYYWNVAYGDIPATGVPRARWASISNEPYWETGLDAVLTAALRRNDDGNWSLTVASRSFNTKWTFGGGSAPIPDSVLRPMLNAGSIEQEILGSRATETLPPAKPIILLKRRFFAYDPDNDGRQSTKATSGLMIWLEPGVKVDVVEETLGSEPTPSQPKPVAPPSAANPAADESAKAARLASDEKAIQGTWEVVSSTFKLLEVLPGEDDVAREQVRKSTNVTITADMLRIAGSHVTNLAFDYKLRPAAGRNTIDLESARGVAWGIYELAGNELKICTSPVRHPSQESQLQRPAEFWAELGSGKELLVLRRIGDASLSADEKAILGTWRVERLVIPGNYVSAGGFERRDGNQQVVFSSHTMKFVGRQDRMEGGGGAGDSLMQDRDYALNPNDQPKRIDFVGRLLGTEHAIYELQGDQLTLVYTCPGRGGPRPSKLAAGPDAAMVVLKRVAETTEKAPAPANPLADVDAIRGRWKVVHIERGKLAMGSVVWILGFYGKEACPADRGYGYLNFHGDLEIVDYTNMRHSQCTFGLDPAVSPKTIDLTHRPNYDEPHWQNPTVLGIYEVEGDRMRLCLTGDIAGLKPQHPQKFAVAPGSTNILLTLQRDRPSDDETAIQGQWNVIDQVANGKPATKDYLDRAEFTCRDNDFGLRVSRPGWYSWPDAMHGFFTLDAAAKPKAITMKKRAERTAAVLDRRASKKEEDVILNGIYTFEKDRLTIAYRTGGPRPEKFESTPGSGVTMLVLRKPSVATGTGGTQAPGALSGGTSATAPSPPAFRTATVTRGDITRTISATGTIEPAEVIDVGAQVAGTVVSLGPDPRGKSDPNYKDKTIDYGSPVEEGTVLARIDDALYQTRVDQQKAACARAEAELAAARAMTQTGQAAKTTVAVAAAAVGQAKAALKEAEINLERTIIRSPCKGVIVARRINVGQNVGPGPNLPSLFLIAKSPEKMQIWVAVNEVDVAPTRKGMEAIFTIDAIPKETFKGTVAQIRQDATRTQNVVYYTVVVDIANSDPRFLPYLTANVQFPIEKRPNVLRVANAALRWKPRPSQTDAASAAPAKNPYGGDRGWLWAVAADGKHVRRIEVQIGITDGTKTEVSGPEVKEGMEVVTGETVGPEPQTTNPAP